jgi:hypothetical protein
MFRQSEFNTRNNSATGGSIPCFGIEPLPKAAQIDFPRKIADELLLDLRIQVGNG